MGIRDDLRTVLGIVDCEPSDDIAQRDVRTIVDVDIVFAALTEEKVAREIRRLRHVVRAKTFSREAVRLFAEAALQRLDQQSALDPR